MMNSITSTKKNIVSFFIRHPKHFVTLISTKYSFSFNFLNKHRNNVDWKSISQNEEIKWDLNFVDKFCEKIDWFHFTTNPSAFKDLGVYSKYKHLIDWDGNGFWASTLASNTGMPWSIDFIEPIKSKLDFDQLSENTSVNWTEELIDKYIDRWDFNSLILNDSFPWSIKIVEKYLDIPSLTNFPFNWNEKIKGSIDYIEKFKEHIPWHLVFANLFLPWYEMNLMHRWEKYIDYYGVAMNPVFFQNNPHFFYEHLHIWNKKENGRKSYFNLLLYNPSLPWSVGFINEFRNCWDWEQLCSSNAVPWNAKWIDAFYDKVEWGGEYPCPLLNEYGEEVSELGGTGYIMGLSQNESIPWSIEFIMRYENRLYLNDIVANKAVWKKAFSPYVDDELIETVFSIIL